MKDLLWIVVVLVTFNSIKPEENIQQGSGLQEVFCTDDAVLFFISAKKDVTSPETSSRLRILQLQDGTLLLHMGEHLVYPVIPNITPVFRSEENGAIMLPDLQKKGAAIGLQLPEGLGTVVHELLYHEPPPENVGKVLSGAEAIASTLVQRAEMMGDFIEHTAMRLQTGTPAPPASHHRILAGTHAARSASTSVVGASAWASLNKRAMILANMMGKATKRVGQIVGPFLPVTADKPIATKPRNKKAALIADGIAGVGVEAIDKITDALKKSAQILTTSLKDNTVHVVQHRYGEDMGEAVEDVIQTAKNTVITVRNVKNMKPNSLARKAVRQISLEAAQEHVGDKTGQGQYTCSDL